MAVPVKTSNSAFVVNGLGGISMTTLLIVGAAQDHQMEPPAMAAPGTLLSPVSKVAPTSVPVKVSEEPGRAILLAKLSFGGGDWAKVVVAAPTMSATQRMHFLLIIVRVNKLGRN